MSHGEPQLLWLLSEMILAVKSLLSSLGTPAARRGSAERLRTTTSVFSGQQRPRLLDVRVGGLHIKVRRHHVNSRRLHEQMERLHVKARRLHRLAWGSRHLGADGGPPVEEAVEMSALQDSALRLSRNDENTCQTAKLNTIGPPHETTKLRSHDNNRLATRSQWSAGAPVQAGNSVCMPTKAP